MNCPIIPLNGYIVIKPIAAESRTETGLYMPETAREVMSKGTVVAVCEESYRDSDGDLVEPTVHENDVVLYHKANATHFKIDNQDLYLIKEMNLYGALRNSK